MSLVKLRQHKKNSMLLGIEHRLRFKFLDENQLIYTKKYLVKIRKDWDKS